VLPVTVVRVCPLAELAEGTCRRVETAGRAALVTVVDGSPYALDDHCLHRDGRLSDGTVRGGVVTCPEHWWRYDLRTGARIDHPGDLLPSYRAREVDGWVEVDLPEADAPRSLREILLAHARGEDGA
jgi:nitrite reductase (NADH) small subunit